MMVVSLPPQIGVLMSRCKVNPLRPLSDEDLLKIQRLSRSGSEAAETVARAKALLAVAEGYEYVEAARRAGWRSGDAVSRLVGRVNARGLEALLRRAGQGAKKTYTVVERRKILDCARRAPDPVRDGTATWSLVTLQRALRCDPALSQISTYTIWAVLHEAGFRWILNRSWCESGKARRRRKRGTVEVSDPDAQAKKKSDRASVSRR